MNNNTPLLIRKTDGTLKSVSSFNVLTAPDLITSFDVYFDTVVIIGYVTGNEKDLKCCVSKVKFDPDTNTFTQVGLSKLASYNYVNHWYDESSKDLTIVSIYDPKLPENKVLEVIEFNIVTGIYKTMFNEVLFDTDYLTLLTPKFHKNNVNKTSVTSFILSDTSKDPKQVLCNVFLKHYKDRCEVDKFININMPEMVFKEDIKPYNSVFYVSDAIKGEPPYEFKKYSSGNEFLVKDQNTLRKDGYKFKDWIDTYTNVHYNVNQGFTMPASAVTFSADWNPTVTVSYDLSGAVGLTPFDSNEYIIGDTIVLKNTPKAFLDDKKFYGWYDGLSTYAPEATIPLTVVATPSTLSFSASWMPEVRVSYYGSEEASVSGLNPSDFNVYVKGMSATVASYGTLTLQGSSFSGWNYDSQIYQPGDYILIDENNITLSATWKT
jgi:hypothetical protein